jgi:hypothetical protein
MADNVTKITSKDIAINLASLDREDAPAKPFVVSGPKGEHENETVTFTDPSDLEWEVLLVIDRPVEFLRHVLSEQDRKTFKSWRLPGWQMRAVMQDFQTYYGLDKLGNGDASRTL